MARGGNLRLTEVPMWCKFIHMTLAEYLRTNGIRLESFAARIGRSTSTVSRIARREVAANHDTMAAIVQATEGKVSFADLILPPERKAS